jgi:UPF0271 protein
VKLNCDLGELQHSNDAEIMPYIDQANIACGFHASDPFTMLHTVRLAVKHNVTIGAHPSYPDKKHFGRRSMKFPKEQLIAILHYQIGALMTICQAENTSLCYVKPHGALYNDMMLDSDIFNTVCQAMASLKAPLPLMIQALPNNTLFSNIAKQWQITLISEAFADRAYQRSGLLVPRSQKNAVLDTLEPLLKQARMLVENQTLITIDGHQIDIKANSLCVHGDTPAAITLIKALRHQLDAS